MKKSNKPLSMEERRELFKRKTMRDLHFNHNPISVLVHTMKTAPNWKWDRDVFWISTLNIGMKFNENSSCFFSNKKELQKLSINPLDVTDHLYSDIPLFVNEDYSTELMGLWFNLQTRNIVVSRNELRFINIETKHRYGIWYDIGSFRFFRNGISMTASQVCEFIVYYKRYLQNDNTYFRVYAPRTFELSETIKAFESYRDCCGRAEYCNVVISRLKSGDYGEGNTFTLFVLESFYELIAEKELEMNKAP